MINSPDFDDAFDFRDRNRPEPVDRLASVLSIDDSTLIVLFCLLRRVEDRVLLNVDEVEGEGSVIMKHEAAHEVRTTNIAHAENKVQGHAL